MVEYSWEELLVIFKFKVKWPWHDNVTGQHSGFNNLALAPVCVSLTINSKFTRTHDFVRACNYTRIQLWIQYSFFLFNNLKNNYCTSKLIILAVFVLLIKQTLHHPFGRIFQRTARSLNNLIKLHNEDTKRLSLSLSHSNPSKLRTEDEISVPCTYFHLNVIQLRFLFEINVSFLFVIHKYQNPEVFV